MSDVMKNVLKGVCSFAYFCFGHKENDYYKS